MCFLGLFWIFIQHGTTVIWRKQPFMWVNGYTVRPFDTTEQVSYRCSGQGTAPVSSIYMKPQLFFFADLGYTRKIIYNSRIGSATRSHHGKNPCSFGCIQTTNNRL